MYVRKQHSLNSHIYNNIFTKKIIKKIKRQQVNKKFMLPYTYTNTYAYLKKNESKKKENGNVHSN